MRTKVWKPIVRATRTWWLMALWENRAESSGNKTFTPGPKTPGDEKDRVIKLKFYSLRKLSIIRRAINESREYFTTEPGSSREPAFLQRDERESWDCEEALSAQLIDALTVWLEKTLSRNVVIDLVSTILNECRPGKF